MSKAKKYLPGKQTGKIKKKKPNLAKEPLTKYFGKDIRIFNSFQEAEEYELLQVIKQDPVERIRETVELILRVYGFTRETLNMRPPDNTVKIIRYE